MPLGSSDKQIIRDHVEGLNCSCPLCGSRQWEMCDDLASPLSVDLEYKRTIEGKYIPMVILICSNCGNIVQISAKKVGLF